MEKSWVMRNKWIFFVGPLAIVLFTYLFGELVMHLWNWLLPPLFGWREIGFWQALGLLVLCRILFGGMGGGGKRGPRPRRMMAERWERMTPEEREQFRQKMSTRCGGFDAPAGGSGVPA
jgi:hypothetical protein